MTLTRLDETLRHTGPTTFDMVGTSDHRFYDRYWFSAVDPAGAYAVMAGMGLYANLNVLDGFVCVLDAAAAQQHNLRLSRVLRPDIDSPSVGPLSIAVDEPYQRLTITLAEAGGMSLDAAWTARLEPHEEAPRYDVAFGRVTQQSVRYDQIGALDGTLRVGGAEVPIREWFAVRDHSWGVRADVGGWQPRMPRPRSASGGGTGTLYAWLFFLDEQYGGVWQVQESGAGTYIDGSMTAVGVAEPRHVSNIDLDLDWQPDSVIFRSARATVSFEDGSSEPFEIEPLMPPWVMRGGGYDRGFLDGKGHGVFRGEDYSEQDTYRLREPDAVVLEDGTTVHPFHRDTPVRVRRGGIESTGYFMLLARPPLPRYGLTTERRPWTEVIPPA